MRLFFTIVFGGSYLLFILAAIPLYLRRVPPNALYGFRTSKTKSNPDIWYAANAQAGKDLMVAGAFLLVALLVSVATGVPEGDDAFAQVHTALMTVAVLAAVAHSYRVLRRM